MKCQRCGREFPKRKGRFCGLCFPEDAKLPTRKPPDGLEIWPANRLPRLRWKTDQHYVLLKVPKGWSLGRFLFEMEAAFGRHGRDILTKNENISRTDLGAFINAAGRARILHTMR